jgi:YbgC/YbaW family acyl-CoA thioester hydrolase
MRTLRMVVQAWHCDHIGHLNAGLYMQWLGDGAFSLFSEYGLDGENTRKLGVNMAAVRAEIDFRRELKPGDTVVMDTELEELNAKTAVFRHRLTRLGDNVLAMDAKLITVCLDLITRKARPFPEEIAARLAPLLPRPPNATMALTQPQH